MTLKIRFTVYKNRELGEYEVRRFENNRRVKGCTYYTDDIDDAKGTMLAEANRVVDTLRYKSITRSGSNSITITLA